MRPSPSRPLSSEQSHVPVSSAGFVLSSSWRVWEPISITILPHPMDNPWLASTPCGSESLVLWRFGVSCSSFNLEWDRVSLCRVVVRCGLSVGITPCLCPDGLRESPRKQFPSMLFGPPFFALVSWVSNFEKSLTLGLLALINTATAQAVFAIAVLGTYSAYGT